ncbi:hypothetical protein AWB69_04338 [Caballeronia udeis]|uniref:DUF1835 domain-containing protein n=1 Tax=Caballeronia udeis TaxID=1232866 RepID=A0A158HF77_9BURK|nr:DUF1835 domain-containing protein [Caballeronia udeis]SAL42994.1 hypothetical protein AWB69_04338 [Caballeronia udeis]
MSTIHVTNGDHAAEILREALQTAARDERVIPLKDDLAVGQLRGIDDNPETRALFWQQVLIEHKFDFISKLKEQDALLRELAQDSGQVVIWHGQSASDQLTLRRVAYTLRNTPQRLNEAKLTHDDLPLVTAADGTMQRRGRQDGATAVGMFTAAELGAKLPTAAPISVLRISRLALEWQEVKQINSDTRRWRDNTFVSGTFSDIDETILQIANDGWQEARRLAGEVMGASFGFLVSDSIALWRCRELVAAGKLEMRGDFARLSDAQLRRAAH